ncbi:MAG: type VI secretion protein IcmF/TssM N-terminal domain-containing protein [Planctomycetota bacterium]
MIRLTQLLSRAQALQTTFKLISKPFKAFSGLPRIIKIGILAITVLALTGYIFATSDSKLDALWFLVIIALVVGGLWLVNRIVRAKQRRSADEFDAEFSSTEMVEDLRDQWSQAADQLSSAGVDRYNMAFYMLIGEPQSGKTTTLQKSGLNFPIGVDKIKGIGGTRNLDWWFTDEAVILDTAGRLTFQEEGETDAEEWGEFLELLRRYRPRCPINGVIVTIPVTALKEDANERERKAQVIRAALVEIERNLEVQFPVYVLVTKADNVGGFSDFFSNMSAMEQTQLLGWSRPNESLRRAFDGDEASAGFDDIVARMRRWRIFLMDQMVDDNSQSERDGMYSFPEEFALLKGPLIHYLESIFPESRLLDPLFFRGFYITSGIQKGVPVLDACARVLGGTKFGDQLIKSTILEAERAYFIRDFYRKKVFQERGLIVPTKQRVRKVTLVKKVGYSVAAAAGLLGTAWVGHRYLRTVEAADAPREAFVKLKGAYTGVLEELQNGAAPDATDKKVLGFLSKFNELGGPRIEASGETALAGIAPDILGGRTLTAGAFLRMAEGGQLELQDNVRKAVRTSFNRALIMPLAERAFGRLEELRSTGTSTDSLTARVELRVDALEDMLQMMAERDRAATTAEAMAANDESLVAGWQPPTDLDGFFRLTRPTLPSGDGFLEDASRAYSLLRGVGDHSSFYDQDLVSKERSLAGLGLTDSFERLNAETGEKFVEELEALRSDVMSALRHPGEVAEWFDAPSFLAYDKDQRLVDHSGARDLLAGDDPEALRARGYLLLRLKKLQVEANGHIVAIRAEQKKAKESATADGVDRTAKEAIDAAIKGFDAAIKEDRAGLTACLDEMDALVDALGGRKLSVADSLNALVEPLNGFHRRLGDLAGRVEFRRPFREISDEFEDYGDEKDSDADGAEPKAGESSSRNAWLDPAKPQGTESSLIEGVSSALTPSKDKPTGVQLFTTSEHGAGTVTSTAHLADLRGWLRESREDLGLSIDWADPAFGAHGLDP